MSSDVWPGCTAFDVILPCSMPPEDRSPKGNCSTLLCVPTQTLCYIVRRTSALASASQSAGAARCDEVFGQIMRRVTEQALSAQRVRPDDATPGSCPSQCADCFARDCCANAVPPAGGEARVGIPLVASPVWSERTPALRRRARLTSSESLELLLVCGCETC